MEIDAYDHGVPSWIDQSSPDPEKASEFYTALFGWQVFEAPDEGAGGYRMCYLNDRPVAGISPSPDPSAPPAWMMYVTVDSADAAAGQVAEAGGQPFMEPFDVLDVGRMFVFADPQGAVAAVWEAKAHHGAGIVNEPNTFCWSELHSPDINGSAGFYGSAFGWGVNHDEADGQIMYSEFTLDGRQIAGMSSHMPEGAPPHWLIYFAVADIDATMAKGVELGATQVMPPMAIPAGRIGVLVDPTGAAVGLVELSGEGMG